MRNYIYVALRDPVASPAMECIEQSDWLGAGKTEAEAKVDALQNFGSLEGVHCFAVFCKNKKELLNKGSGDVIFYINNFGEVAYEAK